MYRIFCESYKNYVVLFDSKDSRLKNAQPLELILNPEKYKMEEYDRTELYKKLSTLLFYMNENIDRFPKFKAFLWTLNSRGIIGEKFNIENKEEIEEQMKLVNSILKLTYWDKNDE